jgi:hypothetical protein
MELDFFQPCVIFVMISIDQIILGIKARIQTIRSISIPGAFPLKQMQIFERGAFAVVLVLHNRECQIRFENSERLGIFLSPVTGEYGSGFRDANSHDHDRRRWWSILH